MMEADMVRTRKDVEDRPAEAPRQVTGEKSAKPPTRLNSIRLFSCGVVIEHH
jgi:hypothetical protein